MKQNSVKTVQNCLSVSANHSRYPVFMQTAVRDDVNKTLANKH